MNRIKRRQVYHLRGYKNVSIIILFFFFFFFSICNTTAPFLLKKYGYQRHFYNIGFVVSLYILQFNAVSSSRHKINNLHFLITYIFGTTVLIDSIHSTSINSIRSNIRVSVIPVPNYVIAPLVPKKVSQKSRRGLQKRVRRHFIQNQLCVFFVLLPASSYSECHKCDMKAHKRRNTVKLLSEIFSSLFLAAFT